MHLHLTALIVAFAAVTFASAAAAAPQPHLLIDDTVVASSTARRVVTPPTKIGPVIDGATDHNFTPYVSVIQDGGRYRMWFNAVWPDGKRAVGYTESPDGLHWGPRTYLPLANYTYGASIVKTVAGYTLAWYGTDPADPLNGDASGLWIATSTDGIAWPDRSGPAHGFGDIVDGFVLDGQLAILNKQVDQNGHRHVAESVNGGPLRTVISPDAQDRPDLDFYGLGGITKRGDLYVGFLRVLLNDMPGTGYTVLAWSHDGLTWQRDRQQFLDRSAAPGWDHAMAWASSQVVTGSRTLVYYGGYEQGHKINQYTERRLGVATMTTDRYVARTGGTLVTKPLALNGRVTLNMAGTVRARIGSRSCSATGDGVAVPLVCNGRLPARGAIRFDLTHGRLWAIR